MLTRGAQTTTVGNGLGDHVDGHAVRSSCTSVADLAHQLSRNHISFPKGDMRRFCHGSAQDVNVLSNSDSTYPHPLDVGSLRGHRSRPTSSSSSIIQVELPDSAMEHDDQCDPVASLQTMLSTLLALSPSQPSTDGLTSPLSSTDGDERDGAGALWHLDRTSLMNAIYSNRRGLTSKHSTGVASPSGSRRIYSSRPCVRKPVRMRKRPGR